MAKVRVHSIGTSLDGYAAGPDQSLDTPFGVNGNDLSEWMFSTRSARTLMGMDGGEEGIDNDFFAAGDEGVGASIMGRNMFGPIRGRWGDEQWTGWWGDNPPYHHPPRLVDEQVDPPEIDETWELLAGLPLHQRVVLVLRYYEDLPVDAIAQIGGCRPATVRTRIHRALSKLRKEVTP